MLYQTMAEVAALLRRHQFPQSHLHLFRIFDAVHDTNPVDQTDTVGIGYRGAMFYADLAYKFSSYKEDFYPFINAYEDGGQLVIGSPEATKVKNTRSQVLLTLGLRF